MVNEIKERLSPIKWDIDKIKNSEPDRGMGDISRLKKSIEKYGLLHSVTIDKTGKLIAGRRRLAVYKELGRKTIPVKIVDPDNESDKIAISIHENTYRKDLTDIENALLIVKFEEVKRKELGSAKQGGDQITGKKQTLESKVWSSKKTAETFDTSEATISQVKKIVSTIKTDKGKVDKDLSKLSGEAILEMAKAPKLKEIKKEVKKEIKSGKKLTARDIKKKVRKQEVEEKLKNIDSLPKGKFDVIYADPPWRYDFSETTSREIENKYPTMDVEDIKVLEVPSADNAVLYLWATAPKLRESLAVMEAWGFEYKSNMVWDKEIIGMGYWSRGQHELLLIGTKGKFSPPPEDKRISSVIKHRREKHSKKPDKVYDIIEKMFPNGKYIELFARNKRKNWRMWGVKIEQYKTA